MISTINPYLLHTSYTVFLPQNNHQNIPTFYHLIVQNKLIGKFCLIFTKFFVAALNTIYQNENVK